MPPTADDPQMVPQDPLPGPEDVAPRRLTRSTTDKHVAGVSGGLGRYFGIDPVIFRVAFGAATLVSGIGLLAYIALVAFLPKDNGDPAWIEGRSRVTTIVLTAILAIVAVSTLAPPAFFLGPGLLGVAACSVLGLVLYRAFGGNIKDDPAKAIARATLALIALAAALGAATGVGLLAAIGGGTAMAVIAVFAGLGLIAAGMLGGPRWLILPVIVLVMPLAVVSAADIDLRGGVGERVYRPTAVADLRPEYRLGVGHIDLDLRDIKTTGSPAEVNVKLGMGEARVRVPFGACVLTRGNIGVGAADVPKRVDQGFDIDLDHGTSRAGLAPTAPTTASTPTTVVVNADIGVGHLQIDGASTRACA
jgi:phage shock protein PspC (stress-responsive transcriptional regulator)